ncbi:DUF6221 family protein [Streptomyces siamensis]|uniref:DUF4259 domain-containing protein n=1 Tax=Streptomyces siamensis TaxID=1274986 RepID=A0ABP9JKR9_9ACTN
MTEDLARWLGEQLDEDERIALAASPGPWSANAEHDEVVAVDGIPVAEGFALSGRQLRATVDHIAAHDPARVLREIEAKRRILYLAVQLPKVTASTDLFDNNRDAWAEVLKQLALSYTDRPGFREDWRP